MTSDMDTSNVDEYYVTALQIFDFCGAESSATVRVDDLMNKFAPLIKTNKTEYSHLRSLLDPEQENPEISVSKLARALNNYSESQKSKVDLDESFNLKCGPAPQDSDSGISDGFQMLEELQCELREKSHLALRLRSQLEFADRQHEELLAKLTAERDSLRTHLNMLRDENMTLVHVRRDYDEACERLCSSEQALDEARRELDALRRRTKMLAEQVAVLDAEKLTLQDLLTSSKDECHRINEMYATRQAALLVDNESLRTEHADLSSRLQDQDEFLQQIIKDKVLLEMELKDMLNKSNQTHLRMDRSIDVSYTEDQMLTALDSLNTDSRFSQDYHLLDEESFANDLKGQDQGRPTNLSLFDEIRLNYSNNINQYTCCDKCKDLSISTTDICLQTDDNFLPPNSNKESFAVATQTESSLKSIVKHIEVQTDSNNNTDIDCLDGMNCLNCEALRSVVHILETKLEHSQKVTKAVEMDICCYQDNLGVLQKLVNDGNVRNVVIQKAVDGLQAKIVLLEAALSGQRDIIDGLSCEVACAHCQTDCDVSSVSTQAESPCSECQKLEEVTSKSTLRRYFWDPLKCLFQVFALVCFLCAVSLLYGVTRRWQAPCRDAGPWQWPEVQDLVNYLFRIEYVADVPM